MSTDRLIVDRFDGKNLSVFRNLKITTNFCHLLNSVIVAVSFEAHFPPSLIVFHVLNDLTRVIRIS